MGFSLVWNNSIKWVDGVVIIDFNISPNVRREPESFPGLPDSLEIMVYRKEATGFFYNKMRSEYFETEDFSKAQLVFEGKPERKSKICLDGQTAILLRIKSIHIGLQLK